MSFVLIMATIAIVLIVIIIIIWGVLTDWWSNKKTIPRTEIPTHLMPTTDKISPNDSVIILFRETRII